MDAISLNVDVFLEFVALYRVHTIVVNCIGGVMVAVVASITVHHRFEPQRL
jgi:hypothetical protein